MSANKTIYYILGALLVLVLIVGCGSKQAAPTPTAPAAPAPVAPAPVVTQPTPEPPVLTEEGKVAVGTSGILSNVACKGRIFSAVITNLKDTQMAITPKDIHSDLRIFVNGVNARESVCEKTTLGPKESMTCSDLIGNEQQEATVVKVGKENVVSAWFMGDEGNRGTVKVTCTE